MLGYFKRFHVCLVAASGGQTGRAMTEGAQASGVRPPAAPELFFT